MSEEIVVVVAGGGPPRPEVAHAVPAGAPVIAADGGLGHAQALGLRVTLAVGDFDSVSADGVSRAEAGGTRIVRHPAEKDATDLELALETALQLAPARVLVIGSDGGRLDHLLSMLLLLGSAKWKDVQVDAEIGPASVHVIRSERAISGEAGELLSLLALHGPAEGVRTEGLAYPLTGDTLEPGSSRGVSNVFTTKTARVSVEGGVVLAICPGREEGGS